MAMGSISMRARLDINVAFDLTENDHMSERSRDPSTQADHPTSPPPQEPAEPQKENVEMNPEEPEPAQQAASSWPPPQRVITPIQLRLLYH